MTHLSVSESVKFVCCCVQIDAGNVVHLGERHKTHRMQNTCNKQQ